MKIILLLTVLFLSITAYSQDKIIEPDNKQNFIISGLYGNGKVIPSNNFVRGDNLQGKPIENFQFFALKALWHNPNYSDWQKVYKGPYYGFGLAIGKFDNPKEIGYPISYYSILGIPIKRWNKLEIYTEFQFGMESNWDYYDPISNPKNNVIGGSTTFRLDIALKMFYSLSPKLDLGAGLNFIHSSNGGFKQPNKGFNLYTPFAELRYRFNNRPDYKNLPKAGRVARSDDLYFMMGFGDPQKNYFAIGGLSAIYFNQLSNVSKIGLGTDLNYWDGLNNNSDETTETRNIDNLTIGLILQPEVIVNRLTLLGGIGIYARHLDYGNFIKAYQRLGVRCEIYKNCSIGVNVRGVDFIRAEFFEFNLGYSIRWMK